MSTLPSPETYSDNTQGNTQEAWQYKRQQAAQLFAQGVRRAQVARQLGICRQTASLWYSAWQQDQNLTQKKRGPKNRLSPPQIQQLAQALVAGPQAQGYETDLWTLERIGALIDKLFGVRYHRGYVWYLLEDMGFSSQKPQSRAIERDEEAITRWKEEVWPLIKRGHKRAMPG